MPKLANKRVVLRDFSGGLFELGNDFAVPPNGLRTLTDAYPQPGGGLRAGPKWSSRHITGSFSNRQAYACSGLGIWHPSRGIGKMAFIALPHPITTGVTAPATGVYWLKGPATPSGSSETGFRALTYDDGTWAQQRLHEALTDVRGPMDKGGPPVRFIIYAREGDSSNPYFVRPYWHWGMSDVVGDEGVFRWAGSTSEDQVNTEQTSFLVSHQDRLCLVDNMESGIWNRNNSIRFTDPRSNTWPTDRKKNRIVPGASSSDDIDFAVSFFPDELIVHKPQFGFFSIGGSLAAPLIRQLTNQGLSRHMCWGEITPIGIVFVTDSGVRVYTGGAEVANLSPQIHGNPFSSVKLPQWPYGSITDIDGSSVVGQRGWFGNIGTMGDFIVTPHGYAFHIPSQSWFIMSDLNDAEPYSCFAFDPGPSVAGSIRPALMCAGINVPASGSTALARIKSADLNEDFMSRKNTYSFAPAIVTFDNRRTSIQQLEFHLYCYDAASKLTVTVETDDMAPVPHELTQLGAGMQVIRLPLRRTAAWIKLDFEVSAGSASVEAPVTGYVMVDFEEEVEHSVV